MQPNAPRNQRAGAGPRKRILRIGVLLGGKIVEERLIRERAAVSIGQSAKNTFSVPLEQLPREWTLFAIDGDHYKLQFGPKMDGRVSDGAQVYTLEQVKGGKAIQQGDHWLMPLSDQARGKVSMGDLTLLLQFVTEPPVQPKPMLPASVRGTLADRIDPRLAVIESISIVICMAVMLAALIHDSGAKRGGWAVRSVAVQPEETANIDVTPPVTEPVQTAGSDQQTKQPDKPIDKPKPTHDTGPKNPTPSAPHHDSAEDTAHLQEEVNRYVATLTGEDTNATGTDGRMSKTAPGGDIGQQADEVAKSGANVKIGGASDRGTRGDGDPRAGTGHGPKVDQPTGPDTSATSDKQEKIPKGRIQVGSPKTSDDTTLTPDAVLGKITSVYLAGLQRCYKNLLKTDPTARGKVGLEFTVNSSGRVTGAHAKADNGDLASCIQSQMANWTFPPPKDSSDKSATDANFSVTLALQPE